jgi:hypothetical protein
VPEFVKWLDGLPSGQKSQVQRHIGLLQAQGHRLRMPYAKHIKGSLFELRPTAQKVEIRVFYVLREDVWVLTGGQKNGRVSERFYDKQIRKAEALWKKYGPKGKVRKQGQKGE